MSRTRQVVWASALSGASVFISMAATLVLFKLATKSLPVEDFAVFLLIQAWADALNIFTTFGLGVSLPRIIAATPEAARARQVGVALTGAVIVSLTIAMALIALWCFAAGTFSAGASRFLHYAWLVPPLYFAGALRDIALAGLAGLHRFAHRAASIVVASLLIIALASAGVYAGAPTVATFSGAVALGHGLNLIWLYAALPAGARWQFAPARYIAIARDSMALFQNSVLTFLYQRLDTFLAERFLGLHAVSMLGAAKQFPAILSRVTGALLVPLLPNLSGLIVSGELTTASRVLNRAVVLSAVIGYTAALGGAALAQPLIRLIASPDYVGAAPVLGLLMAAMSLAIQAGVMGQGLIALGRAASVTQVNTVLAAVSIALNCLLLPRFGILGAGYAALAAVLFSAAAQALLASRHGLRVAWRPLLTLQALFAGLYAGGVVLGGAWGLLIATALFPVLCVATGALPHGEVRALLQAVLPRR